MTDDDRAGTDEAIGTYTAIATHGAIRREERIPADAAVVAHADARPDDDIVLERHTAVDDGPGHDEGTGADR